jgi:hypothetical protein
MILQLLLAIFTGCINRYQQQLIPTCKKRIASSKLSSAADGSV